MKPHGSSFDPLLLNNVHKISWVERIDSCVWKPWRLIERAQDTGIRELRQPKIALPAERSPLRQWLYDTFTSLLGQRREGYYVHQNDETQANQKLRSPSCQPTRLRCDESIVHVSTKTCLELAMPNRHKMP